MIADQSRAPVILLLSAAVWVGSQLLGATAATNVALTTSPTKSRQDKKPPVDEQTIHKFIKQLGDNSFYKREEASKRLTDIGEPALELVKKAAKDSTDLEIRVRAERIAGAIGSSLFFEVRKFEGHAGTRAWVTRIVVTPDGGVAVSVGLDAVRTWDIRTGKQLRVFGQRNGPYSFALGLSPDGKSVIAGSNDTQSQIFDLQAGNRIQQLVGHNDWVWGAALLADGKRALTGASDNSLRLWDIASGKEIRAFEGVRDKVRCLAVSPDGKLAAVGHYAVVNGPGTVRLWDIETGKELRAMEGHAREVSSISFGPGGKTILSSSFDRTLRLWDVATGKELMKFVGHAGRIEAAAFTPDGKRIVSCGNETNPTLRIWEANTGKLLYESLRVDGGFLDVAVLPDGHHCITAGRDSIVRLWQWKH